MRFRISHWSIPDDSVSQRILTQLHGLYGKTKTIKSPEYNMRDGLSMALPWSHKLNEVKIVLFFIDDRLKLELGSATYPIPTDRRGVEERVVLDVFPNGGRERIGKLVCSFNLQQVYAEHDEAFIAPPEQRRRDIFDKPIPGFRFKRLSKAINWNRLRMTDVNK
jgi:hypothetical protein